MSLLTKEQLNERCSNKLEAQLFFAHKKLEQFELELAGVIPTKINADDLQRCISSQKIEVEVLNHIFELIELSY